MQVSEGELTSDELKVVRHVSNGEIAKFSDENPIRAEIIRQLMLGIPLKINGKDPVVIPTPCGVRVEGALIEGLVDLVNGRAANGSPMPGLHLGKCRIPKGIDIRYAQLGALYIEDTRIKMVSAVRAVIQGEIVANRIGPCSAGGECYLSLHSLHVDGDVQISLAELREGVERNDRGRLAQPLDLRKASINGDVYIRNTTCHGSVDLSQVYVEGNVSFRNSQLYGRERFGKVVALFAENAVILGAVAMRHDLSDPDGKDGFEAHGPIDLSRTKLGAVRFDGAKLRHDGELALDMVESRINGSLYFVNGFNVEGMVRLKDVFVESNIDGKGAYFSDGFDGNGLSVKGDLDITDVTALTGKIDLSDANIGSVIKMANLKAEISLMRAHAQTLDDGGQCSRGRDHHIHLDGFAYDRLENPNADKGEICENRLLWLSCQGRKHEHVVSQRNWFTGRMGAKINKSDYHPQPYMQLRHVLASAGYENDSRQIERAKLWIDTDHRGLLTRIPMTLFGMLFGFGYSSKRAAISIIAYFILGWIAFYCAGQSNMLIVQTQPVTTYVHDSSQPLMPQLTIKGREELPCKDLDSAYYALDLMVPLIDLHTEQKCDITDKLFAKQFPLPGRVIDPWLSKLRPTLNYLGIADVDMPNGGPIFYAHSLWKLVHTAYAMFGWLVVSLSILTFSGLLRQKERRS